jgi:hypothetical protein
MNKKKIRINSISITAITLAIVLSVGGIYPLNRTIYAHTFSGGESASFLALATQIAAEAHLVQANSQSNITLAQDHAVDARQHLDANTTKELTERNKRVAHDLTAALIDLQRSINSTNPPPTTAIVKEKVSNIDGLLQEALSARVEPDQMKNATVHILALNNILNEITEHYGGAYGIEEGKQNETSTRNRIVNMADYQSAQSYANQTLQMFNDTKRVASSNITSSPEFSKIDTDLTSLKSAIESKKQFKEVQQIIEGQLRPHIESTFKLKLKGEA